MTVRLVSVFAGDGYDKEKARGETSAVFIGVERPMGAGVPPAAHHLAGDADARPKRASSCFETSSMSSVWSTEAIRHAVAAHH
ncbi:MAG: hypothetical protein K6L81_15880 [Agarilytica sp.]